MKNNDSLIKEMNEVVEQVGDAWEAALSALLKRPLSLDEISESYSKRTDKFILEVEKREGYRFVAGSFFISQAEKGSCAAKADLYFQNPRDGGWVKKELKGYVPSGNITEESKKEIEYLKIKEYEVSHPEA